MVHSLTWFLLSSDSGSGQNRRRTFSDSASECKAETEYLQTARKGGGHKGEDDRVFTDIHSYVCNTVFMDRYNYSQDCNNLKCGIAATGECG